jgi:flagellin-like protein
MKKGISPLISAVLLIAMAVSLSVIVGGWARQVVTERTEDISEQTKTQLDCASTTMYIKDFSLNCTSKTITADVKNMNQQQLRIQKLQILNESGSLFTFVMKDDSDNTPVTISAGSIKTLTNNNTIDSVTGFDSESAIDKIFMFDMNCPDARDEYEPKSSDFLSC